mmetsp:Transcript_15368/g.27371  ORF Transcript_15368/g.27371 Transcript_15368/m.27371 type:complete len:922 (-) Transcript_15368:1805-4570(-)
MMRFLSSYDPYAIFNAILWGLVVLLLVKLLIPSRNSILLKRIPGPTGLPYFGHSISIYSKKWQDYLYVWSRKYDGLYRLKIFGSNYVVISDPVAVHQVLNMSESVAVKCPTFYKHISQLFEGSDSNGASHCTLFTASTNDQWHSLRRSLLHSFSVNELEQDLEVLKGKALIMLQKLMGNTNEDDLTKERESEANVGSKSHSSKQSGSKSKGNSDVNSSNDNIKNCNNNRNGQISTVKGSVVDGAELAQRFTLDAISLAKLGYDFEAIESSGYPVTLQLMNEMLQEVVKKIQQPWRRFTTWFDDSAMKGQHTYHIFAELIQVLWKEIKSRGAPPDDDCTPAAQLIRIQSNPMARRACRLSESRLPAEIGSLLLLGGAPTAHALTWALRHVAADPAVQAELLHEMDENEFIDDPGNLSLDQLRVGMPYLDAVVRETLRLHPPFAFPLTARRLQRPLAVRVGGKEAGFLAWDIEGVEDRSEKEEEEDQSKREKESDKEKEEEKKGQEKWEARTSVSFFQKLKQKIRSKQASCLKSTTACRIHMIPAGTTILIDAYSLHRSPYHWRDPDRFLPERWLTSPSPAAARAFDLRVEGEGKTKREAKKREENKESQESHKPKSVSPFFDGLATIEHIKDKSLDLTTSPPPALYPLPLSDMSLSISSPNPSSSSSLSTRPLLQAPWCTPRAFIPFGVGERCCLGQQFALLALKVPLLFLTLFLETEALPCTAGDGEEEENEKEEDITIEEDKGEEEEGDEKGNIRWGPKGDNNGRWEAEVFFGLNDDLDAHVRSSEEQKASQTQSEVDSAAVDLNKKESNKEESKVQIKEIEKNVSIKKVEKIIMEKNYKRNGENWVASLLKHLGLSNAVWGLAAALGQKAPLSVLSIAEGRRIRRRRGIDRAERIGLFLQHARGAPIMYSSREFYYEDE